MENQDQESLPSQNALTEISQEEYTTQQDSSPRPHSILIPKNFDEAMQISSMLAKTSLVPNSYHGKPGDILVAIQWGMEIGLRPLQSLNSIAMINGRPAIFGDAALALVWTSGLCLSYDDRIEGPSDDPLRWEGVAQSWRLNTPNPIERRFSVTDARRAILWNKKGPWQEYPRRMLVLRARGFLLRDLYPDVLRGMVTAEELRDSPLKASESKFPEGFWDRMRDRLDMKQTSSTPESGLGSGSPQRNKEQSSTTRPAPLNLEVR